MGLWREGNVAMALGSVEARRGKGEEKGARRCGLSPVIMDEGRGCGDAAGTRRGLGHGEVAGVDEKRRMSEVGSRTEQGLERRGD
ncbi:uncharacterized protein DS421_13g413930 [Arachis hypogaea]|nr:uncharacterized protein DS421_13g413930 [Arachis hypogaea]